MINNLSLVRSLVNAYVQWNTFRFAKRTVREVLEDKWLDNHNGSNFNDTFRWITDFRIFLLLSYYSHTLKITKYSLYNYFEFIIDDNITYKPHGDSNLIYNIWLLFFNLNNIEVTTTDKNEVCYDRWESLEKVKHSIETYELIGTLQKQKISICPDFSISTEDADIMIDKEKKVCLLGNLIPVEILTISRL